MPPELAAEEWDYPSPLQRTSWQAPAAARRLREAGGNERRRGIEGHGATWPEWVVALDDTDASAMDHRDIAPHVLEANGLSGWWAQAVTVGYERLRRLRDPGQRRGGDYEVNKSKTMAVPVADLWHAFHDEDLRGRWLPDLGLVIRSAQEPRSMRTVLADDSRMEVRFTSKGATKSTVSLQHRKLPDREAAAQRRAFWGERLQALEELLLGD